MKPHFSLRQGDVLLLSVATLPEDCAEVPPDGHRIVLAHGEATGHAHAIYDFCDLYDSNEPALDAAQIANSAITAARAKARLWQAPNGERYLEVSAPVTLRHEEHTAHTIPPGIYQLPQQVEYTPTAIWRVAD